MPNAIADQPVADNPYVKKVRDAFNLINDGYTASLNTTNGNLNKARIILGLDKDGNVNANAEESIGSDLYNYTQVLGRLKDYMQPLYRDMQLLNGLTLAASLNGKNAIDESAIAQTDSKNTAVAIATAAKNIETAAQSALKFHGDVRSLFHKLDIEDPISELTEQCRALTEQAETCASTAEKSREIVLDTAVYAAWQTADSVASAVKTASGMLDNLNKAITGSTTGFQTSLQNTFTDYNAVITKMATDDAFYKKTEIDSLTLDNTIDSISPQSSSPAQQDRIKNIVKQANKK